MCALHRTRGAALHSALNHGSVATGGPSIRWTTANTVQPQGFAITTTNDARGINNTWTLSDLCQQNVQIRGANSNTVLYSQPPNTCM